MSAVVNEVGTPEGVAAVNMTAPVSTSIEPKTLVSRELARE